MHPDVRLVPGSQNAFSGLILILLSVREQVKELPGGVGFCAHPSREIQNILGNQLGE